MSIKDMISERNVPSLFTSFGKDINTKEDFEALKPEIKKLFQEEEYGYMPPAPESFKVELLDEKKNFFAGKGCNNHYKLTAVVDGKELSFPFSAAIPYSDKKVPVFVNIAFDPTPNFRQPTTEIIDRGYAVFTVCYKDCTSDDGNFENGVAPILGMDRSNPHATGKIAMWSWCVSRVIDYIYTLDIFDLDKLAVIGHSRLGKTALLAGAFDERFKYVISNDSGCSGAAITRNKQGETPVDITNRFPFWFCPKYLKTAAKFENTKYDQHFLLALSAPRYVLIGSAECDLWADPDSEFLSAHLASAAYEIYGKRGLIHDGTIPKPKTVLGEGDILYQLRFGNHYFSREDWLEYVKFIKSKMQISN